MTTTPTPPAPPAAPSASPRATTPGVPRGTLSPTPTPDSGVPIDGDERPGWVAWLALDAIAPSAENPRTRFDEEGLAELAESIRAHGVLEPVLVRPPPPPIVPDPAAERPWAPS